MGLTKKLCDKATYDGNGQSRDVRWDTEVRGFGLRVFPSGVKSFVLSFRVSGRKRLLTLGGFGVLTVDQARDKAKREIAQVIEGKDPVEVRRATKVKGFTVTELCTEYLERHAKAKKRTWESDEGRIDRTIKKEWGPRPAASIKRSDVAVLHQRQGKDAPYEANRTLALISKMFSLARAWGYLDETAVNPAHGIAKFQEAKRDRYLKPDELPRLFAAITSEKSVYIRTVLILYLLTGARKSELLAAKWEDVDLARRELRLPRTKAGRIHYIPLSREATALLHSLPREEGNEHVFPGAKKGSHLVNVEKAWRAIRKAASLDDVRLHDLRRTVGSILAQSGESLPTIGKILNHSNASTTQIYARFAEDTGRKPLDAHGARLAVTAGEHAEALGLITQKEESRAEEKDRSKTAG